MKTSVLQPKVMERALKEDPESKNSVSCQDRRSQGSAAMNFPAQVNVQRDVTCPICLDLLTTPLSLDCGHSFCQACITAKSKESGANQRGEKNCPVCQRKYQFWNLRPNQPLANIVKKVRENMSPQQKNLCKHHGEKLLIFCKEDGKAICQHCAQSVEHRGHQIFFMEKVVMECQEKLQAALKKLRKEQLKMEELEADIREEKASWKSHMQTERQRIPKGFNEIRGTLDSEEKRVLQKLEEDEVNVLDNLVVAKDQLARQKQCLRELISDIQHQLWGSSADKVQDMINVMKRSESWTFKKPNIVSKKLKSTYLIPDLSGMLQVFKELTEVRRYWVDVMLKPVNAISNIALSADKRQVKAVHNFSLKNIFLSDFSGFDVLGCQCFSSGKYYWEVDVSEKIAWILGVYSKARNLKRKGSSGFVFDPNVKHSDVYSRYTPQFGYWVIGLQNGSEYKVFEESSTSDSKVLTLFMPVPPCRVGVFLDHEARIVSFFNVTNQGSLIYKFSNCQFSQTTYPYFNLWNCQHPITLCTPTS
ncbi:E3 ubiquitin-protein ligase TRIM22-like [Callorhinus ursinus]|uniref:E3 ubiquitin-protein ligase TRIM22-like n=1 Tax=Callorhinus ursinus TaxID=34884 RepID=A0A3Q7NLB1_CALUR|nr:E3 ubiquitin-protein ligase TRIM22-like [Callorhinus ursinus]XP_025721934.1 E3 ubiquitin-protein ligase TRIM22-like [Callorhinus ursinus]